MINAFIKRSKTGLIAGTVGGVVLALCFLLIPSRGPGPASLGISGIIFSFFSMGLPVILSGTICGAVIDGLFYKGIIHKKIFANNKTGSIIGSIAGGLILFPIGAYIGFFFGGLLGGRFDSVAGVNIGLYKITVPVGIAIGMLVVTTFVTLIGSAIGALAGLFFHSVIGLILWRR